MGDLNGCGFRALHEIDNNYEILVHDLEDFMSEIDNEKKKIYGRIVPTEYVS